MQKAKKYDWKDSNMALFGSDTDKKVKKESAETEPAWKPVGTCDSPHLFIWRIEKFKVVRWPEEEYGQFYSGDSYIVLNVFKEEDSDQLNYDVHFWIGKQSTQDEYGTAAYKTVELDTFLDDKAIQHREVQGHESALFKSYFKSITYLKGGCDSGFRRVTPKEYKPRLLHFSGNKIKIVIKEVRASKNHLDSGDVFILDLGEQVFQWNGKESSKDERFKAAQYLQEIKSGRGKLHSDVIDEEDDGGDKEFRAKLSDDPVNVKAGAKDSTDGKGTKCIMRLSDASGTMGFEQIAEENISKDQVGEDDVYIIDSGDAIYVYIGEGASIDERRNGLSYAHDYLKNSMNPLSPVSVVNKKALHGARQQEFDQAFA